MGRNEIANRSPDEAIVAGDSDLILVILFLLEYELVGETVEVWGHSAHNQASNCCYAF